MSPDDFDRPVRTAVRTMFLTSRAARLGAWHAREVFKGQPLVP
jgi:hypothetical protein